MSRKRKIACPRDVSHLISALLEHPGDEFSRFALADRAEDDGKDAAALRLPGQWRIAIDYRPNAWQLIWKPDDGATEDLGVCPFARSDLPRCVGCGKRAHLSFAPRWRWVCNQWFCIRAEGPAGEKMYRDAP